MAAVDTRRVYRDRRLGLGAFAVGAAGLALWALGAYATPAQALHSYLTAYAYVASLLLGVLAFSLISRAMGATWVLAVRRLEEAVIAALPALAALFVPVAAGMDHIYPWVDPGAAEGERLRELLEHKQRYLDQPFFIGRSVFYLGLAGDGRAAAPLVAGGSSGGRQRLPGQGRAPAPRPTRSTRAARPCPRPCCRSWA